MAVLSTQDFTTLVRNTVAAVQSKSATLVNLAVGSVLRAIIEANAGLMLWLQGMIVKLLTLTRAATCVGPDLDSWMADYNFPRLKANAATGQEAFSRNTATQQAIVPFGAPIQTQDGTQAFTVNTDPTNAAYNLALGGYVLPPGTASINLGVTAVVPGSAGNVAAGSITSITQAIPGIDNVTNAAAFTNGFDAESDPAYQARFVLYIASLSRATDAAVRSAIANVQQGLQYTLTKNQNYDGTRCLGFFYAVVDDGTGVPSSTLLDTVRSAIGAYRGLTIRSAVFPPIVLTADIAMTITSGTAFVHATVVAAVSTALRTFINTLPLGTGLPYTQVAAIAYGVTGVTNISAVTVNSGTADLTANNKQVIKCGTLTLA
jgi:uncharacterized phage protein gp47/JayE